MFVIANYNYIDVYIQITFDRSSKYRLRNELCMVRDFLTSEKEILEVVSLSGIEVILLNQASDRYAVM